MPFRLTAVTTLFALVSLMLADARTAGQSAIESYGDQSTWLWVIDEHTRVGIPNASVDIGPGDTCVTTNTAPSPTRWTAHFVTGSAGRVLVETLPDRFSCRVLIGGRVVPVFSAGSTLRPGRARKGKHYQRTVVIYVDPEHRGLEAVDDDYWRTTDDPTEFLAYVEDSDAQLISGVQVRALRSGGTALTDENGLFRLDVPASYRKGKFPSLAIETVVVSKPGYRTLEYRDLILNPGVTELSVTLERGSGTTVHKNLSLSNNAEEVFNFKGPGRDRPAGYAGKIFSFVIEPSRFDGGWILCQPGAEAILTGTRLKSVEVFFYSTGTGIGEMGPGSAGKMKKVSSSSKVDTWKLTLPSLMTTNFWAEAIDENGKKLKAIDLGNVGY